MTIEATPVTSAYSNEDERFTFENDDRPPGMFDSSHIPFTQVADLGVSSTSQQLNSQSIDSPTQHQHLQPDMDDPEICIPEEETLSYTAYCPEDAASAFFSDGEVRTLVPVVPVTASAPSTSFFKDEPDENEIETNDSQDPAALVVATPIDSNHIDHAGGGRWTNRSMHLLKLLILIFGLILVCIVLYMTNVGEIADKISGADAAATNEPSKHAEEERTNHTSTSPTHSPVNMDDVSTPANTSFVPSSSPLGTSMQPSETVSTHQSAPTHQPSADPSSSSASASSRGPSLQPTNAPSRTPSATPTSQPSSQPSPQPTDMPSKAPSASPTVSPSLSFVPSGSPSSSPTLSPTAVWSEVESSLFEGEFASDKFGSSVSMSSNGQFLAVGSASDIVETYAHQGGSWVVRGDEIVGSGSDAVLSGDGSTLLIGNPLASNGRGQISTFEFNSTFNQWQRKGQILEGEELDSALGSVVALSSNGQVMVLGEPGYSNSTGRVRLYEFGLSGWTLLPFDPIRNANVGDQVGNSVAVSSDGYTVAVGVMGADRNGGRPDAGLVSVYRYNPQNQTVLQVGRTRRGGDSNQGFGKQVVLAENGSTFAQLSQSGNVAAYEYDDMLEQWKVIWNRDTPVGIHNRTVLSIGIGIDLNTHQTTLAMSYKECQDEFPCGANEETGSLRVMETSNDQGAGSKKWIRLGRDLLRTPTLGLGLPLALSANGKSIAAGVPGSSGSENLAFAGIVQLYEQNNRT